jgi:hypothetical protein
MISSRPGEVVRANASHQVGVEHLVAEEGLDRGQRGGGVLRLVRAVERQEDLVVLRVQAAQGHHLPADRGDPRHDAVLEPLTDGRRLDLGAAAEQHLRGTGQLLGEDGGRTRLDDPGLLDRDLLDGVAEVARVVDRDRGDDGDDAVGDVGGVPDPAHADLDHGHVDGSVGERGVGHPHDRLEEAERELLLRVDQMGVRRDVVEGAHELLVGQRLAVDRDPLVDPLEVRTGEPARAQVQRSQQGVDHPAGGGLAVGAGEVDHRVGALRVAQQPGERADAVEGRLELGLGPAGLQGVLDLREGLGEACFGYVGYGVPSLGSGHSTRRFAMSTRGR